jgi:hypothetical protein
MNQAFRVAIVILVFFGIFAAGAVTGLVITTHIAARRLEAFKQERAEEQHQQEQRDQADRLQREQEQQKLVGMIAQLRQQVQHPPLARTAAGPGQIGPQLMQRLIRQINPTPAQQEQIRVLVGQSAEQLRRLRRDTAHSTELIIERLQDQIAALLTPEQGARFAEMIEKSRQAFQRYNFQQQMRQEQQRQREASQLAAPAAQAAPAP